MPGPDYDHDHSTVAPTSTDTVDGADWFQNPHAGETFAIMQKRTGTRKPLDSYLYSAKDDVKSKGQGPPSLCKVCSSRFHWDTYCPHWKDYL